MSHISGARGGCIGLPLIGALLIGCTGPAGPAGPAGPSGGNGDPGATGPKGDPGTPAITTGVIHGFVRDAQANPIAGAAIATAPASTTATSDATGAFTLDPVAIGAYSVTASKSGYAPFTLANVGVAAGATSSVSLVLALDGQAPGSISGTVSDTRKPTANRIGGVTVRVQGSTLATTTAVDGSFTLANVPPGPVFLSALAPSSEFLDTETRTAVIVPPGGAKSGIQLVLSSRPSDSAQYVGMNDATRGCWNCHPAEVSAESGSAHMRSLTRIQRDSNGHALAGAFARMLNATLAAPRTVMIPLAGTITVAGGSNVVVGSGTAFASGSACTSLPAPSTACQLAPGDELGYTPVGLGWQKLGTIQSVDSDTQVTLTASATFAPTVASLAASSYGVKRLSRSYTKMLPQDANDIVAPAWPGVKATNPNYDPNDPCIYGNAPAGQSCAAGGTTKYADGQVNAYFCNLKDGVTYLADEYVQKFGGAPYSCSDGVFYDGGTTPVVPMVHIDVIYGGQGDKDTNGNKHPNLGVFKQRFQGRLSDVKAAAAWSYTAGKALDSLTLPIQVLESGDKVNGGYKMNGYHPTEQKFPGESWSQRTRTFSHACAGCHNTGLQIEWDMVTVTLPFGRDGAPNNSPMEFAAIKSYKFLDENLTCEHCHGPGSQHAVAGDRAIINPKYLTAEAERQTCGKCHAYDDANNAKPLQDYGFEYPWNSDYASVIGGGSYVPGVYDVGGFFANWEERLVDDEAFWDPVAAGGKLYGQAHRQQNVMLAQSAHINNPYYKTTCTSCHDGHTQYRGTTHAESKTGDQYVFAAVDFRDNVQCLSCHAGGGPVAAMATSGPFANLTKDDIANLQVAGGGTVTKNGVAVTPSAEEINGSKSAIVAAVGAHMFAKTSMIATYDPLNDALPVGRCTSCHMPKVAKSGGYTVGLDADTPANKAIVEGDEASHVFDVIWPYQSNALSRSGPTFQSGYMGQFVSAGNVKYDMFGFMSNSCSKCHANARRPILICPDSTAIWPSYWPFSEHPSDPYWTSCFTTATAP
jgi:hypothetical protein